MLNEIIAIYAITDDLLKAIGHKEDSRRAMNDAEIITTAICAASVTASKNKESPLSRVSKLSLICLMSGLNNKLSQLNW